LLLRKKLLCAAWGKTEGARWESKNLVMNVVHSYSCPEQASSDANAVEGQEIKKRRKDRIFERTRSVSGTRLGQNESGSPPKQKP